MGVKDNLGDYLKTIEHNCTTLKIDGRGYVYARLDGRSFHTLTRGLERPFSGKFATVMRETALEVAKHFHADICYVQSDEISLGWFPLEKDNSEFSFSGKLHKLTSVMASYCSAAFILKYEYQFEDEPKQIPAFDCRIMDVSEDDFAKFFLWRAKDCFKNSVSAISEANFGSKAVHGKHGGERLTMLEMADIRLSDFDSRLIYGTYYIPKLVELPMDDEMRNKIPERNHKDTFIRKVYEEKSLKISNLIECKEFIFDRENLPQVA